MIFGGQPSFHLFEPNALIYKYAMPRATDLHQYDDLEPHIPGLEPNQDLFQPIASQPFEPVGKTEPIPVEITNEKTQAKTHKAISGTLETTLSLNF